MAASKIRTIGIVGTGVIGSSWTALFLSRGLRVLVSDPGEHAAQKLKDYLHREWPLIPGKAAGATLDNYEFVGPDLSGRWTEIDFVQENAPEKPELKSRILAQIDANVGQNVPIASSSSGLPSSSFIGDCHQNPGRILIGHPFNPPHMVPLVEIVPHPKTHDETITIAKDFYTSLGKRPIILQHEVPGFVANRIQAVVVHEAASLVARGIVTPEELDIAMTQGLGLRWALTGPFMTNILGGGGNPNGYTRITEGLGRPMAKWIRDIRDKEVDMEDRGVIDRLEKVVEAGLGLVDTEPLEKQRDELLLQIAELKQEKKALL